MDLFNILSPIIYPVAWILYGLHWALALIFGDGPSGAWILSIVFLTIIIRICILPLFIKSLKSNRKMQAIQPQIRALQKKYKDKKDQASREAMSKETMALYSENGVNPVGGCLPMLLQSPFFLAIMQLFYHIPMIARGDTDEFGPITQQIANDIEHTEFFGIHLSDTFNTLQTLPQQIVVGFMIAILCGGMFISMRIIGFKNMPQATKDSPMFKSQKVMMMFMPLMYIFSGVVFPVAILFYMVTTNIWTIGQGLWQLEFIPTPGSEAADKKEAKEKAREEQKKELLRQADPEKFQEEFGVPDEKKQQRKQPTRKKKKGK